jgi:hypothetical protein
MTSTTTVCWISSPPASTCADPCTSSTNNGDGTFADRTGKAGLSGQLGGLNIIQADYNNDGCMDILVLRGGWEIPQRMSLLRNNCNGTFTDVTKESGLMGPASSQCGPILITMVSSIFS